MATIEQVIPPTCEWGYTPEDLENIFTEAGIKAFKEWHYGQTGVICNGRQYNHDTQQYEEACGGQAHGPVYYTWDVQRYIDKLRYGVEVWD